MNDSILVKVRASEHCISFRTVSRTRKSPHWFYIVRSAFAELEAGPSIIVHDICSFAILRRDMQAGTLEIRFTWLNGAGSSVSGYEETVTLPYTQLAAFVRDSAQEGGPEMWKALSIDLSGKKPRYVFHARETLRAALNNGVVRRKLVRFLRDNFNWQGAEQICFYADFLPYSFTFQEIRGGRPALTGGLILHGQEDMQKAYYSLHT